MSFYQHGKNEKIVPTIAIPAAERDKVNLFVTVAWLKENPLAIASERPVEAELDGD